jgi:crotonobetainyl-CoA:carnitine CoA-transferase CaiB-like acyl-CoA transferase
MVTKMIEEHHVDELTSIFERLALPFAPVRRPGDLVDDPHLKASGGLLDIALPNGKRAKVPALPISFNGVRAAPIRGIPTVGADTRSVLRDIDLTEAEIAELFGSKGIADRPKLSEGRGADQQVPSAVTG